MDESAQTILRHTGIHPKTMDALDDLVIAAIQVGQKLETENGQVAGDPLYDTKLRVAAYVAALERAVKGSAASGRTLGEMLLRSTAGAESALPLTLLAPDPEAH